MEKIFEESITKQKHLKILISWHNDILCFDYPR